MKRHLPALILVLALCGTCGDEEGDKEPSSPWIGDWECESPTPNCVKAECAVGCVGNYHCEPEMPYCLDGKCTADCTPVCPVMTYHGDCGMDDGCGGACGCLPDEICRESWHVEGLSRCLYGNGVAGDAGLQAAGSPAAWAMTVGLRTSYPPSGR